MRDFIFTSESVTEGHPDKVADQISDAILDAVLAQDPLGRVACETLVTTGLCVVAGEMTTSGYVDIARTARETICGIGYDRAKYGFDGHTCGVLVALDEQSPDIAQGVDSASEQRADESSDPLDATGAGDQAPPLPLRDNLEPLQSLLFYGSAADDEVRVTGAVRVE